MLVRANRPTAVTFPGTGGGQGGSNDKPFPGNTTMTTRFPSCPALFLLLLPCLFTAVGCEEPDDPLTLDDLSGAEYVFVERMVILERAKAAALFDREAGTAILDSLALAWGDSSLPKTLAGAPQDPHRSEAVAELLRRVLQAEQESLATGTPGDRLSSPLPGPAPAPAEPPTDTGP
jgi:hypothetical protein